VRYIHPHGFSVDIRPAQLVHAARGFSCLFWGMALGLLLFTNIIAVRVPTVFRLPAYMIGVVAVVTGATVFHRMSPLSARWGRQSRQLLAASLMQLYMVPFVGWWQQAPGQLYYALNLVAMLTIAVWLLAVVCLLAAETGYILHHDALHAEGRICAVVAPMIFFGPTAFVAVQSVAGTTARGTSFLLEVLSFAPADYAWLRFVAIIPFLLSMAIVWEAKECCLGHLKKM
jgi:hypothetical protein